MSATMRRVPWRAIALVLSLTASPAGAQGLGRCADPRATNAAPGGPAAAVHPLRLREAYASAIVAGDWVTVVSGYGGSIRQALDSMPAPSPAFAAMRDTLRRLEREQTAALTRVVTGPRATWDAALQTFDVNLFRPVLFEGRLVLWQSSDRPFGVPLDTAAMTTAEVEALCWSSWALYSLAGSVNFQTVPAAVARVQETSRRWDRYRDRGPLQLPHELVVNRLLRRWQVSAQYPYAPPRWTLVAVHPFAGLEVRREGSRYAWNESAALELAGVTWWVADWRVPLGASWVAAADADGAIGQGVLARIGGVVTAGVVDRRLVDGRRTRVLLLQLDALRLLAGDGRAKELLSRVGVAGEILATASGTGRQ